MQIKNLFSIHKRYLDISCERKTHLQFPKSHFPDGKVAYLILVLRLGGIHGCWHSSLRDTHLELVTAAVFSHVRIGKCTSRSLGCDPEGTHLTTLQDTLPEQCEHKTMRAKGMVQPSVIILWCEDVASGVCQVIEKPHLSRLIEPSSGGSEEERVIHAQFPLVRDRLDKISLGSLPTLPKKTHILSSVRKQLR